VNLGLKDVGYEYINTDDTWSSKSRGSDGSLVPDPNKWPNGIATVATQIHGMGLKMG
jgi:alpha-galactosidase